MAYSNTTEDKDNYGFDCNFVSEPPPELLCPICAMVLRDPYQSVCCGGHYCQCCAQQLVEKNIPCTLCGGKVEIFRDVNVTLKVNSLQVKCSNSYWGCEWEGELGHLGEHSVKCEQKPARCGMCGYFVPSGTFRDHESLHCPLRTYTCTHCSNFTATYDEVCHRHWPVCPCYPVSCPNECSKQKIPRNKLLHHLYRKCDLKRRVCDMTETIEHLQLDLQEQKLRISELEAEAGNVELQVCDKSSSKEGKRMKWKLHSKPNVAAPKYPHGVDSVRGRSISDFGLEGDAAMGKTRNFEKEANHLKECIAEKVAVIKELRKHNSELSANVVQMEDNFTSQLRAMTNMCQKLCDEKEALERRLSETSTTPDD